MVQLIDGRAIAEKVKDEIAKKIFEVKKIRPNLAIILVGEREDSKLYVSLKERESVKVGVDTHLYRLSSDVLENEILSVIEFLNKDENIDGILVQLPLPDGFDTDKIIKAIDPNKDVDGFHPNHPDFILSPVLAAIKASLEEIKFVPENKSACILYNSEVFGSGVKELLQKIGVTKFLDKKNSSQADLLVTAIAKARSIKAENIKDGAIIIDISTVKVDGHVLGDLDLESVKEKASFATPVPGGIGPMTIAFLLKNVLEIFLRRKKL
jgi:methylenetetrahydrofolate dehydrogenase (NADP+)/methenyltetrahydrofolate cyclohydrolase